MLSSLDLHPIRCCCHLANLVALRVCSVSFMTISVTVFCNFANIVINEVRNTINQKQHLTYISRATEVVVLCNENMGRWCAVMAACRYSVLDNGTLIVRQVTPRDAGVYRCDGLSDGGSAQTFAAQLTIAS